MHVEHAGRKLIRRVLSENPQSGGIVVNQASQAMSGRDFSVAIKANHRNIREYFLK
ncbi:MAG: hypothetical protein HKN85_10515 [Gammaproteobacteria bacterium]|nr:hypothetical protein [Gammaproteobacteria bacterium]